MAKLPQTQARETGVKFLREARAAGWVRAHMEVLPDGTIRIDASMAESPAGDEFDVPDLRMGK